MDMASELQKGARLFFQVLFLLTGVVTVSHAATIESHNEEVQCEPDPAPYPIALASALQEAGDSSFYLQIESEDVISDEFRSHVMYTDSSGQARVLVSITENRKDDKFITRACVGSCGSCISVQAVSFMHFYNVLMNKEWGANIQSRQVGSVFFPPWTNGPVTLSSNRLSLASSTSKLFNFSEAQDSEGNVFQMWSNQCKPLWLSQYDFEGTLKNTMHYYQPGFLELLVSTACSMYFDIDH